MRYLLSFLAFLLCCTIAVAQPKAPTPGEQSVRTNSVIKRYIEWSYRTSWKWELSLPQHVVTYYQSKSRPQWQGSHSYYSRFIEPNDKAMSIVTDGIRQTLQSLPDFDREDSVMFVVTMVQQMPYWADSLFGIEDYTNFPVETLYNNGGDCEDKAILAAALLKRLGFDVKLIFLETIDKKRSHIAIGVPLTTPLDGGAYWDFRDNNYYYIETTYPGWQIGELPNEWENAMGIVIDVL